MHAMLSKKWKNLIDYEVIMPLVFMIFAVTYYIDVMDKRYVGRILPQIVCVIMIILLARILIVSIRKKLALDQERGQIFDKHARTLLVFVAMLFLYYYVILLIGYVYATLIYIPTTMLALGYKKKMVIVISTILFLGIIYLFFVVGFNFVLPQGSLITGL
jgi:hypothetical protein